MHKSKVPAFLSFILAGLLLFPNQQAAGFFPEDGFSSAWAETVDSSVVEGGNPRYLSYEVRPGDTLWSISRSFGVDLCTLTAVNGIDDGGVLLPGQVLILPAVRGETHRVARGETLWSLSRRYQVSVRHLMSVNGIQDPEALAAGRELVIPLPAAQPAGGTAAYSQQDEERFLAWPLRGELTSLFGPRGGEFHHGLDIAGDGGDDIRAADRGEVIHTGWLPYYGYALILDHGGGLKTLYGHLSEFLVEEGNFVERSEVIGRVGNTGRATGPHLHFEVRINDRAVDPLPFLR